MKVLSKKKYLAYIIIQFMQIMKEKEKKIIVLVFSANTKAHKTETGRITCVLIVFTYTIAHIHTQKFIVCS